MIPQYTPGPWEAVLITDPRGQPVPYYPGLICTVEHGNRYQSVVASDGRAASVDQWVPNCWLIAAAPDLLTALKGLEPFLDAIVCYASTVDEHEPNRLAIAARKAIAKAEGPPIFQCPECEADLAIGGHEPMCQAR